ncbi:response regulator transcription factor [Bifidobacterium sp. 82T10]|uniref:Response regulator transcription factor n=1 Tax=Bifidobacterium miconis TaxID=2834435 RepID=A0ABS6WD63_9BIFI|nr:response regulator transcription factor [Bifidobacterium miconis]MBW3091989.1 response regulator transcription factor [Bifidobacterium miconis]
MARLLLVEDEDRMAQAVAELLRREGHEVDVCGDGEAGAQAIRERPYDAMILDVMLPGRSGTSLAAMTRELGLATPIIMLTAKTSVDDKVTGLDSGADDYLTKPFAVPELLARVRAQLRRVGALDGPAARTRPRTFADLSWDTSSLTLHCTASGQSATLSQRESALFETLLDHPGQVLSRDQLRAAAWPQADGGDYNSVEVYCSFLRRKLAFVGSSVHIKAVRGLGYVLRDGKDG